MTLTRTQMHERATSLSGELKAAREAQSECESSLQDRERIVTIAKQALERASTRVDDLLAERAQLAADMANAILQVGEAPLADEAAPAVEIEVAQMEPGTMVPHQLNCSIWLIGNHPCDCGANDPSPFPNAIFNGVDRAFDEATQP